MAERPNARESKVFPRHAKPTRSNVPWIRVGKTLEMAIDLLLFSADEVARNGALGKKLRPEVFPDAPLHFSYRQALP